MNRAGEERLMRYLDGELDPAEAAFVEQWLAQSEKARAVLRELEVVRAEVRSIARAQGEHAGAIADAVMARI